MLRQKNKLCANTDVEWLTPGQPGRSLHLGAFYAMDGSSIDAAPHPNMYFYAQVPTLLYPGDILRGK